MGELFREFFHLRKMPAHTAELMPWRGLSPQASWTARMGAI